jgi:acyl dehydratase
MSGAAKEGVGKRQAAGAFAFTSRSLAADGRGRCPLRLHLYGKQQLKVANIAEGLMQQATVPHPRGGLYFEDFSVGQVFRHRLTRTVTQMDNMLFSNMTLNPQPLHIDAHFCATETEWGRPLMNSLFTLGLMIGISVNDTTVGTTIANLGMSEVAFPAPLFEGDTVRAETEVIGVRDSRSRPEAGLVEFRHRAFKQDGTLVAECRRTAFMRRRAPEIAPA